MGRPSSEISSTSMPFSSATHIHNNTTTDNTQSILNNHQHQTASQLTSREVHALRNLTQQRQLQRGHLLLLLQLAEPLGESLLPEDGLPVHPGPQLLAQLGGLRLLLHRLL